MSTYDSNDEMERAGWVLLASVDESEPYEVDENHVLYHPQRGVFLLRSASGCSCWNGDYSETEYPTLTALEAEITSAAGANTYNPTLAGAETLMTEAYAAFARIAKERR